MAADRDGWWRTFLELQKNIWSLVRIAVEKGEMTAERAHVYLQSGKVLFVYNYVELFSYKNCCFINIYRHCC